MIDDIDGGRIVLPRQRVLGVHLGLVGAIVVLHCLSGVLGAGEDLFHVGRENGVPAFFSSLQMVASAVVLASIGAAERTRGGLTRVWFVLAAVFVFLAVDESVSIHERLTEPVQELFDEADGLLYHAWVVPYLVGVLIVALTVLPLLRSLPRRTIVGFAFAGLLFVGGAAGVEAIEGVVITAADGERGTLFRALQLLEETMEMLGLVVFIDTLFMYIAGTFGAIEYRFSAVDHSMATDTSRTRTSDTEPQTAD